MQRLKQGRSYLVASAGLSLAAGAWAAGTAPASNSDGTAAELAGKPGVAYRAKLAGESVERTARQARKSAAREAKLAALQAKQAVS